jgi:hypothetical protein
MGLEARCHLMVNGRPVAGTALLETDHLLFRGSGERVRIPFSAIREGAVVDQVLVLTHDGGTTRLALGSASERWLERIRNPRSLLDKLGVKPGMRVSILGVRDADFLTQIATRIPDASTRARKGTDIAFLAAESVADLARLRALRDTLVPNGAIWVVHTKGKAATLRDVEVFAAARKAGLVDTKVAAFSATHTAEKLVIPVAGRK